MSAPSLGEQFQDLERQSTTLRFGMWIFLASELLLFSGLFALYAAYRTMYGEDFVSALNHNTLAYGTVNTYVLLTSSFAIALALGCVQRDARRWAVIFVGITVLLGFAFLAIKIAEYAVHVREGALVGPYYHNEKDPTLGANRFYTLYWLTTGAHALHVTGGLGVLIWTGWHAARGRYSSAYYTKFEMATLYWHFVDVMWLFIWPIYYLA